MKFIVLAAFAALVLIVTPTQSQAQLGEAHFRAWDQHSGKARTTTRRSAVRVAKRRTSIQAQVSPGVARTPIAQVVRTVERVAAQIISHPAGCPRSLFCGCGAALKVFGSPRRDLWHTSAWRKFPRAAPAPGMVAVNGRHIFVIDKVLPNGMVMAYDYNSGGGASRYHMRSLSGYEVRNPRA